MFNKILQVDLKFKMYFVFMAAVIFFSCCNPVIEIAFIMLNIFINLLALLPKLNHGMRVTL